MTFTDSKAILTEGMLLVQEAWYMSESDVCELVLSCPQVLQASGKHQYMSMFFMRNKLYINVYISTDINIYIYGNTKKRMAIWIIGEGRLYRLKMKKMAGPGWVYSEHNKVTDGST